MEMLRCLGIAFAIHFFIACGPRGATPSTTVDEPTTSDPGPTGSQQSEVPLTAPTGVVVVDNGNGSITVTYTVQADAGFDAVIGDDLAELTERAAVSTPLSASLPPPILLDPSGSATISTPACAGVQFVIVTATRGSQRLSAPPAMVIPSYGPGSCWVNTLDNRNFVGLASNPSGSVFLTRDVAGVLWRSTDQGATFTRVRGRRAHTSVVFYEGSFRFVDASFVMTTTPDGVSFTSSTALPAATSYDLTLNGSVLQLDAKSGGSDTHYRLSASGTWVALPTGYSAVGTPGLYVEYNSELAVRVSIDNAPVVLHSLASAAGTCDSLGEIRSASDRLYARLYKSNGDSCAPMWLTSMDGSNWIATLHFDLISSIVKLGNSYLVSGNDGIWKSQSGETFTLIDASAGPVRGRQFSASVATAAGAYFLSYSGTIVRTTDGVTFTTVHSSPDWVDGIVDGDNVIVISRAGELAISRDQGLNFTRSALADVTLGLRGIYRFGAGHYIVYGFSDEVFVSTDAAATWTKHVNPLWGGLYAAGGDHNRLFLVSSYNNGSSNHVVVSDDAGTGFFLDDVLDAPSFCWDSFQVGGTLVCQTNDSHYVSSDGIAWSASPTGGLPTEFIGGDATRFFAGKSGLYYSTTNGTSWSGVVGWPANVSMTGAARVGSTWHVTAYDVTTGEHSLRSSSDLSTWSAKRVGGQGSCSKFLGTSARLLCLSPEGIASLPLP